MKQYIISDTHFFHNKFHSDNWELLFWKSYEMIDSDFFLYILGDLCLKNNHGNLSYIFKNFYDNKKLKNIILILGNHDDNYGKYQRYNVVCCDSISITHCGVKIIMTHEPVTGLNDIINIHGHLHTIQESLKDFVLNKNNILIETEKIYDLDTIIKTIKNGGKH